MKFDEALKAMREGKKVRLKGCKETYEIENNRFICRSIDDEYFPTYHNKFILTNWVIMSEDWEVVEDECK